MPASNRIKVEGAAQALKVLNKAAPEVVKGISKDLKSSVQPVVRDAKQLMPKPSPLSNWGSWITSGKDGRTPGRDLSYNASKARSGIKVRSVRSPDKELYSNFGGKRYKVIPLLELRQVDPQGAIYERIGGGESTHQFVNSISRKHGTIRTQLGSAESGRALYPAFFKREREIMRDVTAAVRRIEAETNKRLAQ